MPDTTRARWHRQADALWSEVSGRRPDWLARAGNGADTLAVEWAVQAANLLRQAAMFNVALSSPERDSLMAANLDWTLQTLAPGARAVVWAHDVHVSRGGDPDLSFNGGAQMGAYLSRIHGDDYRAFSLLTYDGAYSATRSFTDHRMIEAEAFPGPACSLEAALHALSRPRRASGSSSTSALHGWMTVERGCGAAGRFATSGTPHTTMGSSSPPCFRWSSTASYS